MVNAQWTVRRILRSVGAVALAGLLLGGFAPAQGVDDGTVLTMWTRSVTAAQTQLLVDAYNATHRNQVRLTVVPFEQYLQKVGASAGAGDLPDLLGGNVIDGPNYSSIGIWRDITAWIRELP